MKRRNNSLRNTNPYLNKLSDNELHALCKKQVEDSSAFEHWADSLIKERTTHKKMTVLTDDNLNELLPDSEQTSTTDWWEDSNFSDVCIAKPTDKQTWDAFFMDMAWQISKRSKCASRQIGAVLTRDKQVLSIGYNGAPAGSKLCQTNKYCPRKTLGLQSGKNLELCPAVHAEANTIINAAKNGISTNNSTLYCYCTTPCKNCIGTLINAGIKRIVCLEGTRYDSLGEYLLENSDIALTKVTLAKIKEIT